MKRAIPDELRARVAELEARKTLNRPQVIAVLCAQAGGIQCGCGCGEMLDPLGEGVIDEHVRALGLVGSNDLDNRRFYRRPCAKRKTDTQDIPRIAKAKRQSRCVGPREPPAHPIPQHVSGLQSRGFDKSKSRGFNGKVRDRAPSPTTARSDRYDG